MVDFDQNKERMEFTIPSVLKTKLYSLARTNDTKPGLFLSSYLEDVDFSIYNINTDKKYILLPIDKELYDNILDWALCSELTLNQELEKTLIKFYKSSDFVYDKKVLKCRFDAMIQEFDKDHKELLKKAFKEIYKE